ncbi:MAG: SIS domain-containing protein [Pseudomonadota bacterium]
MSQTKRVFKKVSTPFENFHPTAALLMINAVDPQINTLKVFLEAINDAELKRVVVLNKMDLVSDDFGELENALEVTPLRLSLKTGEGFGAVKESIDSTFSSKDRVAILGIFNSGKTSLISKLTGKDLKISDLPGTTLEFSEHEYNGMTLIDTVGQVIDVNKPYMVSIDFSGCRTPEAKIQRVLTQDAEGILATMELAVPQIKKVVDLMKRQIAVGNKIVVIGAGASALVAMEMAGQGIETGVPIMVFTNNLAEAQPISFAKGFVEEEMALARYIAGSLYPGDVIIGVSASGGTGFVYGALAKAREKGAITVAITENIDTPLGKAADYIIKSNAKPEGPSSSKIQVAHLAIGHALMLTLADERGITADQAVQYMMPEYVPTKKMGIK